MSFLDIKELNLLKYADKLVDNIKEKGLIEMIMNKQFTFFILQDGTFKYYKSDGTHGTFDEIGDKACLAGASVYVEYTISGGDAETTIEAWGDKGNIFFRMFDLSFENEIITRLGDIMTTAGMSSTGVNETSSYFYKTFSFL